MNANELNELKKTYNEVIDEMVKLQDFLRTCERGYGAAERYELSCWKRELKKVEKKLEKKLATTDLAELELLVAVTNQMNTYPMICLARDVEKKLAEARAAVGAEVTV